MKVFSLFSCLALAVFAAVAFPAFTEPVAAAVPADHVRIYTEGINPAPAYTASVETVKQFTDRLVFSSFTASTASRLDVAADRSRCPAFLIGADPHRKPNYRALAVPWCRVPR